jgi:hypothetical protein
MDVLRIEDGLIAEIITFDSEVFDWFTAAEATSGRLTFRPEGAAADVYRHIAG